MYKKNSLICFILLTVLPVLLLGKNSLKTDSLISGYSVRTENIDDLPNVKTFNTSEHSYLSVINMLNPSLKEKDWLVELTDLVQLADNLFLDNNLDSAFSVNQKALQLAKQLNNYEMLVIIQNQIGLVYWKKGDYKNAELCYLKSIKLNAGRIPLEEAKSYNYLGLIYWKLSDFPKALDYYLKSLIIKEQLGNQYEIALTLNNIANLFNLVHDNKSAIIYAKKALKIANKINDDYVRGRAYQNLGVGYSDRRDYKNALKYLNWAIIIRQRENQKSGLAYSLNKRGDVYFRIEQLNEAEKDFSKSLEIMKELKDDYGIASAYLSLGKIYDRQNKTDEAIRQIELSLAYSQEEKFNGLMRGAHLLLSKIYKKIGNYKKALDEYSKFVDISKTIDNIAVKEKFGELKLAYETEVKQKENELLRAQNKFQEYELKKNKTYKVMFLGFAIFTLFALFAVYSRYNLVKHTRNLLREKNIEIEKQRKKLAQMVSTKDRMFSIIAHDLKSPFQSLHGYSELLVNEFNKLNDVEKFEYISNIKRISKNSTDLVENLLQWTRAQSGSLEYKPENLNLKEITDSTIELAKSTADRKQIEIISKINPNIFVYADRNIITTILRNLLNNAIKFSLSNSVIEIFTIIKENNIVLNIKDNGLGIEEERLESIFNVCTSTNGTENEIGSGLGLALCKEFVSSYNGEMKVESKINKGSIFSFTIPIYKLIELT